jgi:hypothetical protein
MRRGVVLVLFLALAIAGAAQASTSSWSGRWQRAAGEYGAGSGLFTLLQKGTHVTGAYHWKGCANLLGGSIVGTAHGNSLVATFNHHGDSRGTLRLHLSADRRHITGTFLVTSGACPDVTGRFDATYLGKLK